MIVRAGSEFNAGVAVAVYGVAGEGIVGRAELEVDTDFVVVIYGVAAETIERTRLDDDAVVV